MNRMKRVLCVLTLLAFAGNYMAQGLKVACIDMEKVFHSYYKTAEADDMLKKQKEVFKEYALNQAKEREQLQQQYNQYVDASLNIALTEEVREENRRKAESAKQLLQEKGQEMQQYRIEKQRELQQKYEAQRNTLVGEIKKVVDGIVGQKGYDLVLDTSGKTLNQLPAVIFSKPSMDITDPVITELNKDKPAAEAKP